MSIEARSSSALFKRAEQLKRWEESDTNREPVSPKQKSRKIKFSSGCVFLAACAAGDKEEVLRLLEKGADIDTANVDGLTALHQACIDDNLDMVEFLVEHGADVNRGDNEGWTPLHATASCGFLSIAKYLIEHNANVAAVNNDGELPIDIAESEEMEDLLQGEIDEQSIDCEAARSEEEKIMLQDARNWLSTKSSLVDTTHVKTGATPLHVAAAKGYIKVMKVLLQCGADVDKQDVDGWTPLHAAAHWGQKEASQILVENVADMDSKNYVGQTAFDVAEPEMFRYLEDLKTKQNKEELHRRQANKRTELQAEPETPIKLKRVEVEIQEKDKVTDNIEKKNRVNSLTTNDTVIKSTEPAKVNPPTPAPTVPPSKQPVDINSEDNMPSWRRPVSRQTKVEPPTKTNSFRDRTGPTDVTNNDTEVVLRRTNSFQNDPEFYTRYKALRARIQASSLPNPSYPLQVPSKFIIPPSYPYIQRNIRNSNKESVDDRTLNSTVSPTTTSSVHPPTKTPPSPSLPNSTKQQQIRRSFVPPVRDEESETQRKAHAKRVRETRRSTQGVTLEEIKSAEQLVKKKNQTNTNNSNSANSEQSGANGDSSNVVSVTATITTAGTTIPTRDTAEEPAPSHERRPSWRLRVDNGSKFKLEDATKDADVSTAATPSFLRRPGVGGNPRPASAPVETADTTVTIPLRRPKSQDDKAEQDKEGDSRNAQATLATQAAIQRRRRPKRRSTGVVAFDGLDDQEPEKDSSGGGDFDANYKVNHDESAPEQSSVRSSRLGSTNDLPLRGENGEIDYKKLYEQAIVENDRLKDKLRKSDDELKDTKQTLERLNTVTSKNSLSELEKRERRAMERKLSEMEEELKQLEVLKTENQRLKDENGALIRVISKLSK